VLERRYNYNCRKSYSRYSKIEQSKRMSREPDWSLYRTFLAVVEEGSLSGAGRRLGLTQPTVARHIESLEDTIGSVLFLRSQRGLVPTEVARDLAPHAETLAATAAALLREASGSAEEVRGTVRISASEIVGVERLPPILADLRRRHSGLVVELSLSNTVDDLLRHVADIAVRMAEPTQDLLLAQRLPPIELGLHARRDYIERRGLPTSMKDLANHDLIGFDRETPALRTYVQRFPAFNRSAFAFRADSDLAQLAAIRAGLGIGAAQVGVLCHDPDMVRVLRDEVSITLDMWVVMHEGRRASARHRVVFDALVKGLTAS
jgi:DNA-binding transcriptional LysR family regulator